ncbi:hypothetical protein OTERR_19950 [Oryzomicrobium terrae]|jgi:hypothetical protein|uniref:DUF3567 domain-containing protein n=1 Tax=Oryzomicrobium terrae TaxID=1735038 RepID=A0A5C1E930_9RHOO|nr:DUF3567 family protein [Oryzomicrobium terrae]QEL65471.1 hypothetical protein OTERR_19950 [Oryzomicrobium terrae]
MKVVFNSEHYAVVSYVAQHGYELVEKDSGRMMFIQGVQADHFHDAMRQVVTEQQGDSDEIDAFLSDYCEGATQPISFH